MDYSQLIHDIAKGHADILRSGIEAGEQSAKSEIERLRTINAELLEACKQVSASADENVSIDLKKIHYAILQIRAAIAKAEGR